MNNNEGFKITAHQPANPFAGKKFKIVTYQGDKELASQAITIESQLELKTTLDEIKQFQYCSGGIIKIWVYSEIHTGKETYNRVI